MFGLGFGVTPVIEIRSMYHGDCAVPVPRTALNNVGFGSGVVFTTGSGDMTDRRVDVEGESRPRWMAECQRCRSLLVSPGPAGQVGMILQRWPSCPRPRVISRFRLITAQRMRSQCWLRSSRR
jgi:hypothetical protein